jgi:hypothetical protein
VGRRAAIAAVEEAFRENFTPRGDIGTAVSIHLERRPVFDLAAGSSLRARA